MTTATFTQTWHKHDGGPCPVDPKKSAQVKARLGHGVEEWFFEVSGDFYWDDIIAYTTDIFDGVFPDHIPDAGKVVELTNRIERDEDGGLDEIVTDGGCHLERMGDKTWWLDCIRKDGSSHAIWIKGRVTSEEHRDPPILTLEPTRGAGCENEIIP